MAPQVSAFLRRLSEDPAFADRFFAGPDAVLAGWPLSDEDRTALRRLDRDALAWLAAAAREEPERAAEHPGGRSPWAGVAIALGGCVLWVVLWAWVRA